MRTSSSWILPAALALLLTGCIPSLNPFYEEDDLIFGAGLVGVWVEPDSEEAMTFEASEGETAYSVQHTDSDGDPGPFVVHLFKIGDVQYLDFFPEEAEGPTNDFYELHKLGVHTLMRTQRNGDTLEMAPFDLDWFENFLEAHPEELQHVETGNGGVVLTGPTSELQAFLTAHQDDEGAFDTPAVWQRQGSEPSEEKAVG